MSNAPHRGFLTDFKLFFYRGLAVLLPSVLTIWLVVQAYKFVDEKVADPINGLTRQVVVRALPRVVAERNWPEWYRVEPEEIAAEAERRRAEKLPTISEDNLRHQIRMRAFRAWWDLHPWLNLFGLVLAVVLFYLAGRVFGGYVGRKIADRIERLLARVPIFKQVYPYVKQLVEFMLGETPLEFNRVAMVEYPRQGIWSIGFMTGPAMRAMNQASEHDMVTVFVPSSPTPFTGYTIALPKSDVKEVDMTVEEALRYVVSGGVLVPDRQTEAPDVRPAKATALASTGPSEDGAAPPALRPSHPPVDEG